MELNVVPAFSVKVSPGLAVIPVAKTAADAKAVDREIHVTVTNGTKGAAKATVALQVPAGWHVTPATAPIDFGHEDEALSARFRVTAPAQVKLGEYPVQRGRDLGRRPAIRSSPTATRTSSIRTSSAAR